MNEREQRISFKVTDHSETTAVIEMSGDLDMYTLPDAKNKVSELIESGKKYLVMDLTGIQYVDSSGLGFFIGTLKKLRDKSGDMKLINLNNYIHGIFKLIHLHYIIEVCESLDEALVKFGETKA